MPSGYGLLPVSPPTTGPTPSPISRMITTSGSPRKMSVYTRAGHRSQRDGEMPATASAMPSTRPITEALTVSINVFGSPVLNRSGIPHRLQLNQNVTGAAPGLDVAGRAAPAGWNTLRRTSSPSMILAIAADRSTHTT